jgi:DNA polymerase-3 subunit epsilon
MLSQAQSLETTVTHTAMEAALMESDEIKRHSPPYNRSLRTKEREVRFYSRNLKSSNPKPDSYYSIGPLPSSFNLDPLIVLGDILDGDLRKISREVIEGILDIPPEYLPDRACFVSGVKTFKQEFSESFRPAFNMTTWLALGARFWKEKLEEQAAEKAAKKEADEAEIAEEEALETAAENASRRADIAIELEQEKILELEMQESDEGEIEDTWTPERIVKILKSIIRLAAFQMRRSRWFCRLSESSLVWTPVSDESETKNVIVFEGGIPFFKSFLSTSEKVSLVPGHTKSLIERQKNFDIFVFDRMRITTTEIRRLIQEERRIELWLHPDICLQNEQLKRMLQWV